MKEKTRTRIKQYKAQGWTVYLEEWGIRETESRYTDQIANLHTPYRYLARVCHIPCDRFLRPSYQCNTCKKEAPDIIKLMESTLDL